MFNPRAYENARADGIPVLELVEPAMTEPGAPVEAMPLVAPPTVPGVPGSTPTLPRPQRQFVPLKRTVLTGEIVGPLAALRLTQVFGFSSEQAGHVAQVVEALYRFPLPGDAAVTGVRVRFGDVQIEAHLEERSQAEEAYEAARREGRQASLLTRESPDVFTLRVAGIAAGQDVTVETAYVQLARPEGAGWTLRVPLTTAPRYVRSDEADTRHAQGQPLRLLRDPGHRFALDVTVHGASGAQSSTHEVALRSVPGAGPHDNGGSCRVTLREGEIVPDRDLVLSWRPLQQATVPSGRLWLHDEAGSAHTYFLALVTPPRAPVPERTIPRELIMLVDHSGSMEGAKWAAADWAVKQLLADLDEGERFALGVFHNTTAWLAETPQPGTMDAVQRAYRFLDERRDSGGTELGVALEQALSLPRAVRGDEGYARHVVIITDAQVSDAGRIFRLADDERLHSHPRRISLLCIDAAPNATLAQELAERSGGVARFLTSAPEEEDISTALDEVLAEWARPVVAGLRLAVNRQRLETAGGHVLPLGDGAVELAPLPAGRSVWVAGRVPRGDGPDLRFSATCDSASGTGPEPLNLAAGRVDLPAIKALFGARRVQSLEYLAHAGYDGAELAHRLAGLGYDPEAVLSGDGADGRPGGRRVYAENAQRDWAQALRRLLVREALEFGLVSSETAFVATRSEAGQVVQQTVEVANALPAGWSERFLSARVLRSVMPAAFTMGTLDTVSGVSPAASPAVRYRHLARSRPVRDYPEALMLRSAAEVAATGPARSAVVFFGTPQVRGGEAVLFDSNQMSSGSALPDEATLTLLRVRFPDGDPAALDAFLRILIFVDDLTAPRAQVRLVDVLRLGGERPLNLLRRFGQAVRIVLSDPHGTWAADAPALEVSLRW